MGPVSFQIISDLHLETQPTSDYCFKQTAPYLALLGDIGHVYDDRTFQFLEKQVKRYWAVFFVLGNHEPNGLSLDAAKTRVRRFESRMASLRAHSTIGRFVFLDKTRYDISESLTVLGCTFYSHIVLHQEAAVASRLIDFRSISQWTVYDHNRAHQSDRDWLNTLVSEISEREPNRKIAIFTHHSPTVDERSVDPRHVDSEVRSGFATDLSSQTCWSSPTVDTWAFGHTHFNTFFTNEHGVKILSNQKGYYMLPAESFQPTRVYTLGE